MLRKIAEKFDIFTEETSKGFSSLNWGEGAEAYTAHHIFDLGLKPPPRLPLPTPMPMTIVETWAHVMNLQIVSHLPGKTVFKN